MKAYLSNSLFMLLAIVYYIIYSEIITIGKSKNLYCTNPTVTISNTLINGKINAVIPFSKTNLNRYQNRMHTTTYCTFTKVTNYMFGSHIIIDTVASMDLEECL